MTDKQGIRGLLRGPLQQPYLPFGTILRHSLLVEKPYKFSKEAFDANTH